MIMTRKLNCAAASSPEAAREAGLWYVSDRTPGMRRLRTHNGFRYRTAGGKALRDRKQLARIRSLVIPPAWKDVWICPDPRGHLQATGRDARGRKQYLYHPRWREARDQYKYDRLLAFGKSLGKLRRRLGRDLRRPGFHKDKIVATVVRLLQTTFIRVGNKEYARQNNSFGLTTLRDHHVSINGAGVRFSFQGKSGVQHAVDLHDRRLAKIIKQCQELPGQELFQYVDGAGQRAVKSEDVNAYLRDATGQDFTAKDFRTWAGTVLAAVALQEFQSYDSLAQAKRHIVHAIEAVAKRLGNTKTVCRQCYVHPAVFDAYLDGSFRETMCGQVERELTRSLAHLAPEEAAVLAFLQKRLQCHRPRRKRKLAS
jgi:DNA topoisomerase-1